MKVLLDACVLYPTVMREVLLGAAKAGFFEAFWSDRILEEWARAARKIGPDGEPMARGEIALLRAFWPNAVAPVDIALEAGLWLPDPNDEHVLASAISCEVHALCTLNIKDFPTSTLAEHGVTRVDPDAMLLGFYNAKPDVMHTVAEVVRQEAERLSGTEQPMRKLLKKARLPRLGKALFLHKE